jgi:hypothetical protein
MNAQGYQTIKRMSLAGGLWFCSPVADEGKAGVKFEGYAVPPMLLAKPFFVNVNDRRIELSILTRNAFKDIFARFDSIQSERDFLTFRFIELLGISGTGRNFYSF